MSKRYKQLIEKIDITKAYNVDEASTTVKNLVSAKFDETVEKKRRTKFSRTDNNASSGRWQ